jgi:hypothetical protein
VPQPVTNLDRYRRDLEALVTKGGALLNAIQLACHPKEFLAETERVTGSKKKAAELIESLPSFIDEYQGWYSECKSLIRQLLPDRLDDFVRLYEKPRTRKEISFESYRIEDFLQGLRRIQPYTKEVIVDGSAAIPHLRQQTAILAAVKARFESSLFEIRQLVQADLLDSELDAAKELARSKFTRAAGAVAGVVLEKHLGRVCENHGLKITKKNPTISDLNDRLKEGAVIDLPQWRFVQHLGDIRNLCDHGKTRDPTADEVDDLIAGVARVTKTIF